MAAHDLATISKASPAATNNATTTAIALRPHELELGSVFARGGKSTRVFQFRLEAVGLRFARVRKPRGSF